MTTKVESRNSEKDLVFLTYSGDFVAVKFPKNGVEGVKRITTITRDRKTIRMLKRGFTEKMTIDLISTKSP